jgi:hypothetical protein
MLAAVEVERGDHRSAARILGASEALRHVTGYRMQPAEDALHRDILARIRSEITEDEITSAWSEGAALDAEEVFAQFRAHP